MHKAVEKWKGVEVLVLQEVMKSVQKAEKDAQTMNEQAKKKSAEIIEDAYRQAETIRHQLKEAASEDADRAMKEAVREEEAKAESFDKELRQEIGMLKEQAMKKENEVIASVISLLA